MNTFQNIVANGNTGHAGRTQNIITCADGFHFSAIAGGGAYCSPRPSLCICFHNKSDGFVSKPFGGEVDHDYPGPYYEVEVGFPSERPEPWNLWVEFCEEVDNPTETVYGYVSIDMVGDLIRSHGGEV